MLHCEVVCLEFDEGNTVGGMDDWGEGSEGGDVVDMVDEGGGEDGAIGEGWSERYSAEVGRGQAAHAELSGRFEAEAATRGGAEESSSDVGSCTSSRLQTRAVEPLRAGPHPGIPWQSYRMQRDGLHIAEVLLASSDIEVGSMLRGAVELAPLGALAAWRSNACERLSVALEVVEIVTAELSLSWTLAFRIELAPLDGKAQHLDWRLPLTVRPARDRGLTCAPPFDAPRREVLHVPSHI